MWEYLMKLMIAIPALGCALWFFIKGAQKTTFLAKPSTQLYVRDRLILSPKAMLQVVQVGEQWLLLAVTDQQVTLVKELAATEIANWTNTSMQTITPDVFKEWQPVILNKKVRKYFQKESKDKCQK